MPQLSAEKWEIVKRSRFIVRRRRFRIIDRTRGSAEVFWRRFKILIRPNGGGDGIRKELECRITVA